MRISVDHKTTRSYVSRDRLVGEVEKMLDSLCGDKASEIRWIDVPQINEKLDSARRWTAIIFLTGDQRWCAAAIAGHGFQVVG